MFRVLAGCPLKTKTFVSSGSVNMHLVRLEWKSSDYTEQITFTKIATILKYLTVLQYLTWDFVSYGDEPDTALEQVFIPALPETLQELKLRSMVHYKTSIYKSAEEIAQAFVKASHERNKCLKHVEMYAVQKFATDCKKLVSLSHKLETLMIQAPTRQENIKQWMNIKLTLKQQPAQEQQQQ